MTNDETALAPKKDDRAHASGVQSLLARFRATGITGGEGRLLARLGSDASSLTISLHHKQIVIERWCNDGPVRDNEGSTNTRYARLVVDAEDDLERQRFIDELAARITAQMGPSVGMEVFQIDELRIERKSCRVTVAGRELSLTPIEYKLLLTLVERRDLVLDRRTLLRDVWMVDGDEGIRRVDIAVRRLRVKLESAARFLVTLRGFGYRFGGPVAETDVC